MALGLMSIVFWHIGRYIHHNLIVW